MDHVCMFEERVSVKPVEMTGDISNLILEKLQGKLEGKCSRNGYVIPGSLQLISRSMGMVEKGTYTGDWIFVVQAEGRVIYPPDGIIIEGTVNRKNKAGIYIIYKDAVRIMIPRDLYVGDEEYDSIGVGDRIQVEIKKSRFQVNDREILSVGLFRGKMSAMKAIEEEDGADSGETEEAESGETEEAESGETEEAESGETAEAESGETAEAESGETAEEEEEEENNE